MTAWATFEYRGYLVRCIREEWYVFSLDGEAERLYYAYSRDDAKKWIDARAKQMPDNPTWRTD